MSQVSSLLDPNSETILLEILGGEQIVSPRPAVLHAKVTSRLLTLVMGPYELKQGGHGGWYFLFEPELHVGPDPDIMIPDLAGWHLENVTSEMEKSISVKIAPDWVCEILSPSTAKVDYAKKLPLYAREGVKHVWFIDPLLPLLEVLRLENGRYSILGSYAEEIPKELEPFGPLRLDLLW